MDASQMSQSGDDGRLWWLWLVALIALAAGVLWGLVRLVSLVWDALKDLDKTLSAILVATVFTVLAIAIIVMLGLYAATKRKRNELYREQKMKTYGEFNAYVSKMLAEVADGERNDFQGQQEIAKFVRTHQNQFLLCSNGNVIRAFVEWRETLVGRPNIESIEKMEALFRAMRSDLGLSNWGIIEGDIAGILMANGDVL